MKNLNFGAKAPSLGRKLAVLSALAAIPCFATPIGNLSLANVTNGGVSVTAGAIDFFPPVNGTFGDFSTSTPTSISYNNGVTNSVLTPSTNPYGQVKDITVGAGTISNFIQFYTSATTTAPNPPGTGALQQYPVFDLTSIVPGGSNQGALNDCAGVTALGVSCSPFITTGPGTGFVSPFVLTRRVGYVEVDVGFNLLGRDATGETPWSGGFTTQLTNFATPADVQAAINRGEAVTNSYSGTFTAQVVPEPATYGLMGSSLLLLGFLRRRTNKK
jgi:hypothetical protein